MHKSLFFALLIAMATIRALEDNQMRVISLINERDEHGNTTLMRAAQRGNQQAVISNLRYGADPTLKNYNNKTAAALARENGYLHIVRSINLHRFVQSTTQPKTKT